MTLHKTLQKRDYATSKELLEAGEKLPSDLKSHQFTSILDGLVQHQEFALIFLFMDDGSIATDVYEYDSFNNTIFQSIVRYLPNDEASQEFLGSFISRLDSLNDELEGKTLLSFALENEIALELIQVLVEHGCDTHILDRSDNNLIHQIVKKYTRKFDNGLRYLQFLYQEGVDVDKPNVVMDTPLHIAVREHRIPYIQWLMKNGANANLQNKQGESPFFIATSQGGGTEKYELMRQFDTPDFSHVNTRGETLFYAADLNHLKLLLEDGADLYQTSKDTYGKTLSKLDTLATNAPEFVEIAIACDQFEVNRQDDHGNTLLHKVCARQTINEEKRAKEIYKIVKLLIAAGADVDITNDNEETAMMLAAKDNLKTKTVELLLSHKK